LPEFVSLSVRIIRRYISILHLDADCSRVQEAFLPLNPRCIRRGGLQSASRTILEQDRPFRDRSSLLGNKPAVPKWATNPAQEARQWLKLDA